LRFQTALKSISKSQLETRVQSCPDWNVKDLIAHVVALCSELSTGEVPPADPQAWVNQQIISRKQSSLSDLITEWDSTCEAFASIASQSSRISAPISYDLVVHEHDLLHALACITDARSSESVTIAMGFGALMLEADLAKYDRGAISLRAGGCEWQCGPGEVVLSLDLDAEYAHPVWELLRITGSRRSHQQLITYPWQGDLDHLLPGLVHMELPVNDLIE